MIAPKKALFILLLEGLASSGVQMITMRQTAPFVGGSVLTTSIIISCFLGALALGYFWGGRVSAKNYKNRLVNNIVKSVLLFGLGLSYVFVQFFFSRISEITDNTILHSPLIHLFIYCTLIISPLVFFLGQTVPLLINASKEHISKSAAAGNATALSTVGNVIGCLVTSLVLMYVFGVGASIFINCLILGLCLFFVIDFDSEDSIKQTSITVSTLVLTYFVNVMIPNSLFETTTPYSNYRIVSDDNLDGRRLIINRSSASFIGNEDKKGWPYIEMIKSAMTEEDLSGKNILILGAGGFTLSAERNIKANFTYVDIDSQIKEIAENSFLNESINGEFVVDDARHFLLDSNQLWDYIVVDLYSNSATIPMHTATHEFFVLLGSRLNSDGKVMLNIAANPRLEDQYSLSMDYTIRSSFSRCINDITSYRNSMVNILYFCSPREREISATLYTDNTTEVAVHGYKAFSNTQNWKSY